MRWMGTGGESRGTSAAALPTSPVLRHCTCTGHAYTGDGRVVLLDHQSTRDRSIRVRRCTARIGRGSMRFPLMAISTSPMACSLLSRDQELQRLDSLSRAHPLCPSQLGHGGGTRMTRACPLWGTHCTSPAYFLCAISSQ